ncbi:hypothetical protein JCM11251_003246 [Rhodosporidiobolus azoricus]
MLSSRNVRRLRGLTARSLLALIACSLLLVAAAGGGWLPSSLVASELRDARSVLWIIAHPDDESFFFAPSILNIVRPGGLASGAILCLSVGNHDGVGHLRRAELAESCRILGISKERCELVDVPTLPDDPQAVWEAGDIEQHIRPRVERWQADAAGCTSLIRISLTSLIQGSLRFQLVTFDHYGVSGHSNHRAIAAAAQAISQRDPLFPPTFAVLSSNMLAKYTSVVLLPVVLVDRFVRSVVGKESRSLFINSWAQYRQTRRSFDAHASQARWFRTLFVSFSRYLWFVEVESLSLQHT